MYNSSSTIDRSNLFFHLGLLTRHWRQVLDATFHSAGLTDATWRPLLHLYLLGEGVRQKDLAASVGIEGPSLVRLLDALVAKGLVRRSEDATDRRAKLLLLTPEGQAAVARVRKTLTILDNEILAPYSDEEIAAFGTFIASLESAVNTVRKRVKR
ncbi:MarR family winged helix-turn-helix transcriptional regulator [Geobacter sp. AOG2]|uniref:MarR family winged helix-turn-helix transcriptional regulator n=1 Tax=Geobacter sp. AOG2 TaxID=1566347 RepID=UPI001CC6C53D|nr:MarR family transcriptional regulator [Geobacter sp. AOG2]GFE61812.1 MarR family transcriptional regulator [Geobacter sp. AOG2]